MAAPERCRSFIAAVMLTGLLAACATGPQQPDPETRQQALWEAEAMAWRERRLARLTEPYGWLSLVGLEFLENGQWTLGSAPGNDLVVPAGPEQWGQLMVIGTRAWFDVEPAASGEVRVDGHSVASAEIHASGEQGPTLVEAATVQLQLLERSGRLALRVRDSQAATRTQFAGLDYFPFNPDWRIEARWEAHPPGRTLLIANVLGELIHEPNPGAAEFEIDGRTFGLEAVDSGDQLFFIFADRTTNRETYGLGRFLYSDLPSDGRVVLDFNRAYSPPCAFTEYSTCPLPPPENRLDTRVEAGELAPKPAY